jgi:hypothetical protein
MSYLTYSFHFLFYVFSLPFSIKPKILKTPPDSIGASVTSGPEQQGISQRIKRTSAFAYLFFFVQQQHFIPPPRMRQNDRPFSGGNLTEL